MLDPLTAGLAIAGTAFSAWSSYQSGKQKANAFKNSAAAKREQAARFMERFETNAEFTRLEGEGFKGRQAAEFAASGIDISSGISLSAFKDTANKIERRIEIDRIEAQNQADALITGADLDIQRAGIARDQGNLGVISAFMSGALNYQLATIPTPTKRLPIT